MQSRKSTVLALLTLGILLPLGTVTRAAETDQPAASAVAPATTPATDLAALDADVGLSPEQKAAVNTLLAEMKAGRRAVKQDASLSAADKKTKTTALNREIFAKIKALMTPEQFAKWEKLQEAIRATRKK
jgi:hypothetical protein